MSPCVNNGRAQVFFGTTVSALPPPTTHNIHPEALLIQVNEKTKQNKVLVSITQLLSRIQPLFKPKEPARHFGICMGMEEYLT